MLTKAVVRVLMMAAIAALIIIVSTGCVSKDETYQYDCSVEVVNAQDDMLHQYFCEGK